MHAVGRVHLQAAPALAVSKTDSADAFARYQQERAVCTSGQSNQDQATCLREAGAEPIEVPTIQKL